MMKTANQRCVYRETWPEGRRELLIPSGRATVQDSFLSSHESLRGILNYVPRNRWVEGARPLHRGKMHFLYQSLRTEFALGSDIASSQTQLLVAISGPPYLAALEGSLASKSFSQQELSLYPREESGPGNRMARTLLQRSGKGSSALEMRSDRPIKAS